jgi:hypothetical protein
MSSPSIGARAQATGDTPPANNLSRGRARSLQRPADRAAAGVTLQFHIDRLTLPGLSRADAARAVEAMKQGLGRLAAQSPERNWRRLSVVGRVDGGTLPAGARPEQIGEHLAAQIFRRLSP